MEATAKDPRIFLRRHRLDRGGPFEIAVGLRRLACIAIRINSSDSRFC
jgi:hypothetical protein